MRGNIRTRCFVTIAVLVVSLGILDFPGLIGSAAAQAPRLDPLKFTFLFRPTGSFTSFIVSQDRGFFREQGLDVTFIVPGSPTDALKLVASGEAQMGLAHSTDTILSRSRGVPVVSVATNHQFGMAGVLAPVENNIRTPKDLEGKTVGITGIPANRVMFEEFLKIQKVDTTKVRTIVVGFGGLPALLEGRTQAMGDAITFSEPIGLNLARGKDPNNHSTYSYMAFYKYGLPRYYTFGIITSENFLASSPKLVQQFLRGWEKGLEWSLKNPEEAVDMFLKRYPSVKRPQALGAWKAILEISTSDETKAHGLGWQDIKVWEKQAQFMLEHKLIKSPVDVSKAMTNEYLTNR